MTSKFGKNFPVLSRPNMGGGIKRTGDREKMMFIAAAGLSLSLLVIFFVVLNFRPADATNPGQVRISNEPTQSLLGTVTLLTPEKKVASGSSLSDVTFKEVYWPRNQVPENAILDPGELRGMYAKQDLIPGVPLQRLHITKEPALATLPVTPGNRAVAIPVDDTAGIECHALPGTRVDVILTYHEEGKLTSKVIVQNARVLSYGGDVTPIYARTTAGERLGRKPSSTITLDVSPKDALTLQTARQLGRLSLVMRSADDDKSPGVTEMDQNDIDGNARNSSARNTRKPRGCNPGRIKMDGKEYVVDCDGSISQLVNTAEP